MISLIAAMGTNRVIGRAGALPWHLPADLRRFRVLTWGNTVVMGRKTWEAIGKALPGRKNIVLSRHRDFSPLEARAVSSLEEALCPAEEKIFVIGGEEVFAQAMPLAQEMCLTIVQKDFPGDAFFPPWDQSQWREKENLFFQQDVKNPFDMAFLTLERTSWPRHP